MHTCQDKMSKWFSRAVGWWNLAKHSDRSFQHHADLYRTHLVVYHKSLPLLKKGDGDAVLQATAHFTQEERESDLKTMINQQVKHVFLAIAISRNVALPQAVVDDVIPSTFSVSVRESSVKGAGFGVFVKGICEAGSILAIHPGMVFLPHNIPNMPGFPELKDPNFQMQVRTDQTIIAPNLTLDEQDHLVPYEDEAAKQAPTNPFAVAQYVNHPPEGTEPNGIPFDYDFPPTVSRALEHLIPNRLYEPPEEKNKNGVIQTRFAIPSSVIIASRNIYDGEEIFVDYRFNPFKKDKWPEWYKPYDEEAAKRRWSSS